MPEPVTPIIDTRISELDNLKYLNVSRNILRELEPNSFTYMAGLEMLDLRLNILVDWEERLFRYNLNLQYLNLMNNSLRRITDAMIEDFKMENLTYIDLSNNQLECTCRLHLFCDKMLQDKFINFDQYACNMPDQSQQKIQLYLKNVTEECQVEDENSEDQFLGTGIVILSLLVVLLVVTSLVIYVR